MQTPSVIPLNEANLSVSRCVYPVQHAPNLIYSFVAARKSWRSMYLNIIAIL